DLQIEVTPLFASAIGKVPEVVAINECLAAQQTAVSAHAKEQRAADDKKRAEEAQKKRAEAARAAEVAEMARRAAWVPDPMMMSIRCARFAQQRILDGDANFSVETLRKSGKAYTMQGQLIGHNAFNARIAKRVVCKVYMDMKTGVETYSNTIVN